MHGVLCSAALQGPVGNFWRRGREDLADGSMAPASFVESRASEVEKAVRWKVEAVIPEVFLPGWGGCSVLRPDF